MKATLRFSTILRLNIPTDEHVSYLIACFLPLNIVPFSLISPYTQHCGQALTDLILHLTYSFPPFLSTCSSFPISTISNMACPIPSIHSPTFYTPPPSLPNSRRAERESNLVLLEVGYGKRDWGVRG